MAENTLGKLGTNVPYFPHFSPEALERELVECGFSIENFYSNVAGSPFDPENKEFAVVAKKL